MKSIVTERPLQIVAMDFVGPLPMSEQGNTYALVMVDHFTRWPIAYAVEDTEAETVARKSAVLYIPMDVPKSYFQTEEVISRQNY